MLGLVFSVTDNPLVPVIWNAVEGDASETDAGGVPPPEADQA